MARLSWLAYWRAIREERRQHGWKGVVRRRGWRLVLVVVVCYLIRDIVLYILIPFAVVVGLTMG